jgi:hypothetical protein
LAASFYGCKFMVLPAKCAKSEKRLLTSAGDTHKYPLPRRRPAAAREQRAAIRDSVRSALSTLQAPPDDTPHWQHRPATKKK